MAALEYEVRDEYRDYSVAQLLEAPVTCFQGVGEIQSDILQRYFKVATVKDLANLGPFLEALSVQETVLEGGEVLKQSVADAAAQRELSFHVRASDQSKRIAELPDAPVHVLEGLTPGQDLAFYDAFRITNLTHLAHNRIMLEARVINYLAEHGEDTAEEVTGQNAVSAILGVRAATAAAAQARARSGEFGAEGRAQNVVGDVTEHVRDRVEAMRDRARGHAVGATGAEAAVAGAGRLDAIRQSRERGADSARTGEMARGRPAGTSRTQEILASRGGGAISRDVSASVADRRHEEMGGRPAAGASRTESLQAARQLSGRGGAPQAATGGATVRTRPSAAAARTATATAGAAGAAGAGATLTTEEEAATAAAAAEARRPAPPTNPVPLIAAAVVAAVILAGLIWFLVSRGGPEQAPTTAGPAGTEQTAPDGTAAPGAEGAPGTAGAPGAAATTTGPGTAPPPPAIKGTYTVSRGDTLWFISDQEYADPLNWPSIFKENEDQIRHPDLIFPRQQLRIPAQPEYRFPAYPQGYRGTR